MRKINLTEKHYSATIENDVTKICQPLEQYGISHFLYTRIFNDYSIYTLTKSWKGYYHHCKNEYVILPPVSENLLGKKFHYIPILEDADSYNKVVHDWTSLFNIGNVIYFIEISKAYIDIYFYASTANNTGITNFYLNNIDMLEKFKYYFKEQAAKLIKNSTQHKITISPHMCPNFNSKIESYQKNEINTFTHRQIDCLYYLVKGLTFKQIGNLLGISARTVEHHLEAIKIKLNCYSRSDLISKALQLSFIKEKL